MSDSSNKVTLGASFAFLAPVLWGGMFPVANSLIKTVNAFHMTLIRYVTVAAILVLLLIWTEGVRNVNFDRRGVRVFWLGAFGFAGFGLLAFTALRYTHPTNVSLIMATMPLISVVVASIATRRAPPAYTVATALIALTGVSIVITKGHYAQLLTGDIGLGEALAISGAMCWVIYTRGGASFATWSPLRYTALTTALGCISIAICTLGAAAVGYIHTPTPHAVLAGWPQLTYLIVFAGVMAVFSWNKGIGMLGALNGILFMNLVPVTTFAIEMVSDYRPGLLEIVGALITIAALVGNNIMVRRASAMTKAATMSGALPPVSSIPTRIRVS